MNDELQQLKADEARAERKHAKEVTPLQALKAMETFGEAILESRRTKANHSSAITDDDRRNLELAKRSARDIPTKEGRTR